MKLAIIITSAGSPEKVDQMVQSLEANSTPTDIFVIDNNSDPSTISPHTSAWISPETTTGPIHSHFTGIKLAQLNGNYSYIWLLSADQEFQGGIIQSDIMIEIMEQNPRMAVLAPADAMGSHPGSAPVKSERFRVASTVGFPGFMMRSSALDEAGFLNKLFPQTIGAIHELSYKLYSSGWFMAYTDMVVTTQNTISTNSGRSTREARRFAFDYMMANYGWMWHETFTEAASRHNFELNTYKLHRKFWAREFTNEELEARRQVVGEDAPRIVQPRDKAAVFVPDMAPAMDAQYATPEPQPEPVTASPEPIDPWIDATARWDEEVEQTNVSAPAEESGEITPWPISSDAPVKVMAWPRYDSAEDLEVLFGGYAKMFIGNNDYCLALKHDENVDLPMEAAMAAVSMAFDRLIGPDVELNVLIINDEMTLADAPSLGMSVQGALALPSSENRIRAEFIQAMGCEVWGQPNHVAMVNECQTTAVGGRLAV